MVWERQSLGTFSSFPGIHGSHTSWTALKPVTVAYCAYRFLYGFLLVFASRGARNNHLINALACALRSVATHCCWETDNLRRRKSHLGMPFKERSDFTAKLTGFCLDYGSAIWRLILWGGFFFSSGIKSGWEKWKAKWTALGKETATPMIILWQFYDYRRLIYLSFSLIMLMWVLCVHPVYVCWHGACVWAHVWVWVSLEAQGWCQGLCSTAGPPYSLRQALWIEPRAHW